MKRVLSIAVALLIVGSLAEASNWPTWRGPLQSGVAEGSGYATTWNVAEGTNIAWKVKLPGPGSSTPAVWGDSIFVTCDVEKTNGLVCLDRKGKERWSVQLGTLRKGKSKKASGSNPSPATDGKYVYIYYKSGDFACVDFNGKIVWQNNLQDLFGEDTLWWDLGTSPVLTKKHVVIACMHSGPSYLAGFNKETGDVVWKSDRNLGAPVEAAQSYTTPLVLQDGQQEVIVVVGADHVTGHDSLTGKELWKVGGLNPKKNGYFRSISGPVYLGNKVFAPYARGKTLTAVRLGGTGDVTATHVEWTIEGASADVPTPIAKDGLIYVCRDRGDVVCVKSDDGSKVWSGQLPKNRNGYTSSPILAGGHIYLTREDGMVSVVKAGDEFQLVASNPLNEPTFASPVCVDGKLLLRTTGTLYCIAK